MTTSTTIFAASKGLAVNVGKGTRDAYGKEGALARGVWNHFLALNKERYEEEGKFIFYHEMQKELTSLRKGPFSQGSCGIQQMVLRALDRALRDCFAKKAGRKGFPRFKSARNQSDSITIPGVHARILRNEDNEVTHVGLPKLPLLRVRGLRLPVGARIISVTVKQSCRGLTVSANYEVDRPKVTEAPEASVGIDLGLKDFAVLSTGEKIANPRFLSKAQKRLKRAQRALSRKRKGSVNRRRERKRVARLHAKVSNLRANFHHQLSRKLVDRFGAIAMEDLSIKGLARGRLAGSVKDVGWGEFARQLKYKSDWSGRAFHLHPRFERSTGVCPECSTVGPRLGLSVRKWTCASCGTRHDRDVAAAKVIEKTIYKVGAVCPEPEESRKASPQKRGSAGKGKDTGQARIRPSGPPSNVSLIREQAYA